MYNRKRWRALLKSLSLRCYILGNDPILTEKRIRDASGRVSAVSEKLQEESVENRRAYERFYNSLALFSGGTIALSVTFLGYLKSLAKPILSQHLLTASWLLLLCCLVTSLFYSFLYAHYLYYSRTREYQDAKKRQRLAEVDGIGTLPIANLSPAQQEEQKQKLKTAAEKWEEGIKKSKRWESLYFGLWKWDGRLARIFFPLGLAFLVFFAVANM